MVDEEWNIIDYIMIVLRKWGYLLRKGKRLKQNTIVNFKYQVGYKIEEETFYFYRFREQTKRRSYKGWIPTLK